MITLTLEQLFTPVPSGVNSSGTEPAEGTWLALILSYARTLGLVTDSWQSGDPIRTLLAIVAESAAGSDVPISVRAQGQFLDYAASGTVSYIDANGATVTVPVSPDPADPAQNPDGELTLLDLLGQNQYSVTRPVATYATGVLAVVNTSASTYGPYASGTYHVRASGSGSTYANRDSLTIAPSLVAGAAGTVTGVATGTTTTVTTSAAHGLIAGDPVYVSGTLGVTGLNAQFALVTATPTATTFTVGLATTGTWTSGGKVYVPTLATFVADLAGASGAAAVRTINAITTTNLGTACANLVAFGARDAMGNAAYAALCRLSLGARSPAGASQAYEYFALTADDWLAERGVSLAHGPITSALVAGNSVTGDVVVTVSSASPASTVLGDAVTPGCVGVAVTNATNATPIVISLSATHNLVTGDYATIVGVEGNVAANGTWQVTVLSSTSVSLQGSVGNGAPTLATGSFTGGDLGQVYLAVDTQANPAGTSLVVESATAFPVTVLASVDVPSAYADGFSARAIAAVQAYIESLPVGGNDGTIPYLSVSGAIAAAGVQVVGGASYVREITSLTVNGTAGDVAYPAATSVALVASINVAVRAV
jgi:hypothetical protein